MSSQDLHLIEMLNPYQAEIQNYIDDYQCVSEIRTRDYDPTRGAIKKQVRGTNRCVYCRD